MKNELNPQQALLLWSMLTGETEDERSPMQSKARPDITAKHRNDLVERGYLEKEKRRGAGQFLRLTDKAWAWAAESLDVELMQSKEAARVMQRLLRRLVPFLEQREIPLADLFRDAPSGSDDAHASDADPLATRIETACLALAKGRRKERVRLTTLRERLAEVPRDVLDRALVQLQRRGRLVLYRDDHTSALTAADHAAALIVGDSPRHIVYLEG